MIPRVLNAFHQMQQIPDWLLTVCQIAKKIRKWTEKYEEKEFELISVPNREKNKEMDYKIALYVVQFQFFWTKWYTKNKKQCIAALSFESNFVTAWLQM